MKATQIIEHVQRGGVLGGIVGCVGTDSHLGALQLLSCSEPFPQKSGLCPKRSNYSLTQEVSGVINKREACLHGEGEAAARVRARSNQAGRTRKTGNQQPCFSFSRWNRPAQRLEWEQAGQFQPLSEQCSSLSRQPGNPQLESGKEHRGECLQSKSNPRRTKQYTFTQGSRAEMDFISRNPRILKKLKLSPFTHNLSNSKRLEMT